MNANRNLVIDFRITNPKTGESRTDHIIKPKKGKSIKKRATKKR